MVRTNTYPGLIKGGKFEAALNTVAIRRQRPPAAGLGCDERPERLGGGVLVRAGRKGRRHGHGREAADGAEKGRRVGDLGGHGGSGDCGRSCSGACGESSRCGSCGPQYAMMVMARNGSQHYGAAELLFDI